MMSNNKILTVSYGTFSCTLEGFDDSFSTMKAIAEYFRDLASDDRYFGAEPPQPDAEMLTRIAQKEISRRVQAREHEGKIVLSAMQEQQTDPSPDLAAPQADALIVEEVSLQDKQTSDPAENDVDSAAEQQELEQDAADTVAAEDEDTAAADPSLETANVENAAIADTEIDVDVDVDTPEPAVSANDLTEVDDAEIDEAIAAITDAVTVDEDENDIVPGQPDEEVEAFFADATPPANEHDDEIHDTFAEDIEDFEAATTPAADSIAAKLQRIRAVVSQQDDDYLEDDDLDDDAPSAEDSQDVIEDARRDISEALDADEPEEIEQVQAIEDAKTEDDEIADILARLELSDAKAATAATVAKGTLIDEMSVDEDAGALDSLFEEDQPPQPDKALEKNQKKRTAKLTPSEDLQLEEDEAPAREGRKQRRRARVIKVKRAELEAAIERGELEELEEKVEPALALDQLAPSRTSETSLTSEEEDDLVRELAALEADMELDRSQRDAKATSDAEIDVAKHVQDEASKAAPEVKTGKGNRGEFLPLDAGNDESMDRLLAEADHQMDEPESATRRDAFAHLRAAVAARKADEALGTATLAEDADNAYRNDLADVVRPRRPASGAARTARPGDGTGAPLKLVAEQRIDVAKAAGPVRPRRVKAHKESPVAEPETRGFAEFASEMGATKLPQLLEAAAAYMSFVEDRDQFSRPQLMSKVRQIDPEGFSREDGLRSFGQLLRSGKIEKLKAGRFTASEDIGFRPDQRAAG